MQKANYQIKNVFAQVNCWIENKKSNSFVRILTIYECLKCHWIFFYLKKCFATKKTFDICFLTFSNLQNFRWQVNRFFKWSQITWWKARTCDVSRNRCIKQNISWNLNKSYYLIILHFKCFLVKKFLRNHFQLKMALLSFDATQISKHTISTICNRVFYWLATLQVGTLYIWLRLNWNRNLMLLANQFPS